MARSLTLLVVAAALAGSAPAAHAGVTRYVIGVSLQGRAIYAYETGSPNGKKVLVVGAIHGNEAAGIAIARALKGMTAPSGVDLWIIPNLNPDGVAAKTRENAAGVDLNRNFPWRWKLLTGVSASGTRALSEPETRAAHTLILRLRPAISVWFHQPMGVVDDSQGSKALERRFAGLVGLPLRRLKDYPGSVANWENHLLPGSTAFVVELPAGPVASAQVARYARAVVAIS
jgi:protein MpaA